MKVAYYHRVEHITGRGDEEVYMSRYWLVGSNKSRWALMLHKMHRPDDDDCHHDHPWSFLTLILYGGYVEQVTRKCGLEDCKLSHVITRHNRPGMLLFRRAEHTHRIHSLPSGHCWTLVLRFKKSRPWGFVTKLGWVAWRRFIDERAGMGVLWCGKDDE